MDLFSSSPKNSPDYSAIKDDPRFSIEKQNCEILWKKFNTLTDQHFVKEFSLQPHQRYFEMFLGNLLIQNGITLQKNKGKGPDFHFTISKVNYWIEAICPEPGEGIGDLVPWFSDDSTFDKNGEKSISWEKNSKDKIILRYANAINEKKKKFDKYFKDKLASPNDINIIAINGSRLRLEKYYPGPYPIIVETVFPIGQEVITYEVKNGHPVIVRDEFAIKDKVYKSNNSGVSTEFFVKEENNTIAGILFTDIKLGCLLEPDNSLLFIHNALARNPLITKFINGMREYFLEIKNDHYLLGIKFL